MNNRLKDLRREKKLTQEKVAEEVGINRVTLAKWEANKHPIDSESLIRLADFYDVSVDYILGKSDYRKNENENICEKLGLSEGAVETIRGQTIEDELGTFIYHEINNEILDFLLDSYNGHLLLNALEDYITSVPGHCIYVENTVVLTDIDGNCTEENDLIKEYVKKGFNIQYFHGTANIVETYAKEEINNQLFKLKELYKKKGEQDGNGKKES